METFGFKMIASSDLPPREQFSTAGEYESTVRNAAVAKGATYEDFRIRETELRAHLRNLGTLTGLGAKLLDLVRNTPPPSASKPIEGFSYIDLEEIAPALNALKNFTPATLEVIEAEEDLAAVYHLLLGAFEAALERELHIAVVEL